MLTIAALLTALSSLLSSPTLPPCPTEDSVSCFWDASARGNGVGRSFTVDANGVQTFTN
jgi:hypothetical protein